MIRRLLVVVAVLIGALLVAIVGLGEFGVLHPYRVPSASMEPTLHCARPAPECQASHDDRVIAVRYVLSSPKVGDIIAFHTPPLAVERCGAGGVYIKRIARIVHGRFFLLGDNRAASCDSREWGTIARSAIIGKVWLRYWPPSRITSF